MDLEKNLTFCITNGRTGTTFVTAMFELFDDTVSVHEPEPNFAEVFPQVKEDPREAVEFWKKKLDVIGQQPQKNYVETSNVFGKGFFIPLIRGHGIFPNLLFLNRDFRDTAKSFYKRGSIPARTDRGHFYQCHPDMPGSIPLYKHKQLSDYQLCYWGVLDIFGRQLQAEGIYANAGLNNFAWVSAQDFHDFEILKNCGELFGMSFANEDEAREKHAGMIEKHYNKNPDREVEEIEDIDQEEAIVIDRIAYYNPLFAERALQTGLVRVETIKKFTGQLN